jgi:hypothetical protein
MESFRIIAERKISQAIADGSLSFEQWKNKPLPEDDNSWVPNDLKLAYKMLKNSGFLPPELELRKEVNRIEDLIAATEDEHIRLKQMKKLNLLLIKLDNQRATPSAINEQEDYYRKIVERVTLHSDKNCHTK